MSKIKLVQFGPLPETKTLEIQIGDIKISVQNKITYEQVLEMIQWSINFIMDDRGFISEPVNKIIQDVAVLKYYTNLDFDNIDLANFTQGELYEYYDFIAAFDVMNQVSLNIDKVQLEFYYNTLNRTLESLITYRNSVAGILEMIQVQSQTTVDGLQESLKVLGDEDQFDKVTRMLQLVNPNSLPPQ